MNGLIPPTDPLGVPAPPIIFQSLSWLTLVLHFIFMNYVLGGTLIVTINEWLFGSRPNTSQSNYWMVKVMPVALSLAITMGVAPLLFVQVLYGQFFYTANIMMGWGWMAILGLVMLAFYLMYIMIAVRPEDKRASILTRLIVLINMVLFFTVAAIFTNNAMLTEHPDLWEAIHAGERSFIVGGAEFWTRYLHNVTGAIAIAGLWIAGIARFQLRYHSSKAEAAKWMYKNGLLWGKTGTFLAMVLGLAYLGMLGGDRIKAFMGNGLMFVGWSVGVLTAVASLIFLIIAFMKREQPGGAKFYWGAVLTAFLTLFGMVMGRDLVRSISLAQYYEFADLTPRYEWTSLYMFLATLVVGLLVLIYMIRLLWTIPGEPQLAAAPKTEPAPTSQPGDPVATEPVQTEEAPLEPETVRKPAEPSPPDEENKPEI